MPARVRVPVGEPAAEPVAARQRDQHDRDRVRPHDRRGAERGRDQPRRGDLGAQRRDAGDEDDALGEAPARGFALIRRSPAAYSHDRGVDQPLDRRAVVGEDVAAAQRRREPPGALRAPAAAARAAPARRAARRRVSGDVGRDHERVQRAGSGRARRARTPSPMRRAQRLLERLRVARVADVDDHRAARAAAGRGRARRTRAWSGRTGCRAGGRRRRRSSRSAPSVRRRNGRASSANSRSCGRGSSPK